MKKEIDIVNGKLLPNIIRFTIPILLSGILQTLYNAADSLIVGRYDSANALAAVGTVGSVINVILGIFMGFAIGTNIIAARYWGGGNKEMVKKTSDTALVISLVGGLIAGMIGFFGADTIAKLIKIDSEIIDMSVLYMRIYFLGVPFNSVYNFASSSIRGIGHTKEPMICLMVSGFINVVLNIIFVKYLSMGVAGVALATVLSQFLAMVMIMYYLKHSDIGFSIKNIETDKNILKNTLLIGLPSGINGMVFNISNTMIISAVNSFGPAAVAANTAVGQIEGMLWIIGNSFGQTATTFTSQNIGANRIDRLNKIFIRTLICTFILITVCSMAAYIFKDNIVNMFAPGNAEVLKFARIKFFYIVLIYFIVTFMEVPMGMLRGMGATFIAMLMTMIGVCGIRMGWLIFVLPRHMTFDFIYISYPISWIGTSIAYFIAYAILKKKLNITFEKEVL